jgi:DNA-binding transcriptional LysR family regulator
MQGVIDWNDLRYLLAVRRAGTLGAAARSLGVEHTTVGRRLAALESALGAKLVVRGPDGVTLTDAGENVLPLVEEMERAALAIEARASGQDERMEGSVRVTTSEGFTGFLVKRLVPLRDLHPKLVVEVLSGNAALDLARREADFAVRMVKTTAPDLVERKIGSVGWGLYAAEAYVARKGPLASTTDLRGHDVVGYGDALANVPGAKFLSEHGEGTNVVMRGNSIVSVLNAVSVGMGLGAVPCFLAANEPTLRRLTPDVLAERDVWLVYHPEVAKIARVRAVLDFVIEAIKTDRELLRGA